MIEKFLKWFFKKNKNTEKTDILHKEIDLIQGCINRMANNSFIVKGWMITIVTAVLAFGDKYTGVPYLCLILIFPVISFWYLDACFLQTEKKYRNLYKWVVNNRNLCYDNLYDLNLHRIDIEKVSSIPYIMFSKMLWPLYGIPTAIMLIILYKNNSIILEVLGCGK